MPLEFSRAWLAKVESVRLRREQLAESGELDGVRPEQLAARGAALSGRLRIPVIPIRYSDVRVPFAESELEQRMFGEPGGDTLSLAAYWAEVSGGLLQIEGAVSPWIKLKKPARHYLPSEQYGWSSFGRISELRDEALAQADARMDFSAFDNDGPDGVPNSGDDDGFVDFIALVYALPCPGEARAGAIWPHRAAMPPFETRTIGANGKPIRIADYVVLPAVDPITCGALQIGVLAHETGHALGLPDLYDYDGTSQGIGAWGLMGTGSHSAHHSPSHLGAWEKEQLGWVTVSWISRADSAIAIAPVQHSRTVYRFDGTRGDYLLLENRQRIGSDRHLPGTGLLVWRIDPERGELGAWNRDERSAAVDLVQADGRNDLGGNRRADAGDPFPGRANRTWFRSYLAGGFQLTGIRVVNHVVRAHVIAGAAYPALIPEQEALRLTALAGGSSVQQSIDIRRAGEVAYEWAPFTDAPWLTVVRDGDVLKMTANPVGLAAGEYTDTVALTSSEGVDLAHVLVSFYLASPGVAQQVATELPWSWGVAVRDGRILQASYGWDQLGLRPRPRVLQLWEAATHPNTLTRIAADALYAPIIDARDGATFVLARARDANYLYQLSSNGDAQLLAVRAGAQPAYGAAILPNGDIVIAEWDGQLTRVQRDGSMHAYAALGVNVYQIATDASGNVYAATFGGNILRVAPDGALRTLETGFGEGRLVAIATTATGDVIAAERGGYGRVLLLRRDGSREMVYRSPDSRFYGLAVDGAFLYALELKDRQLLRIPLPESARVIAQDQ